MKDNQKQSSLKELLTKETTFEPDQFAELNDDQVVLIDRAYEYIEIGEYKQALKLFTMGIAINDADPDILNGLGITLSELGMLQESKLILEKAARLNPDDAAILSNLAGVCWDQNDPDKAIYYYNKSIELEPDAEEAYFNLIYLYMETGSLYMAFINCINFQKEFPHNEEAGDLLGEIILNLGISMF
ncbi:MAG: tetratricopeptide repeat protein [bacterium]|nr:tetratricopeptide repeat protein [bacterium]